MVSLTLCFGGVPILSLRMGVSNLNLIQLQRQALGAVQASPAVVVAHIAEQPFASALRQRFKTFG